MPKVKLKVTHTHAGVAYPAGHILDVDERAARWLVGQGIAVPADGELAPAPEAPPRNPKTPKE
jgi:hypothetical protein